MTTGQAARQRFTPRTDELLERLTAIAFALDAEGVVVAWNKSAEQWLGLLGAAVLGKPLAEVPVPWTDGAVQRAFLSVLAKGETVRIDDVRYVRGDGREGLLGFTASPISSIGAMESFVFVMGRDITEQRLRDRKAQEEQKLEAINQLAAGMAHEINTPAQYVSDNLTFLGDAFRGITRVLSLLQDPSQSEVFRNASPAVLAELQRLSIDVDAEFLLAEIPGAIEQGRNGMQRVATIVSAMRCFSHPGQQTKQGADINRALEDITTVSCNEWRYDANLTLDLDPKLPRVFCFLSELSQAVLNVVVNASHAIREARTDESMPYGRLSVGSRRDGTDVVIWVEDTGVGIPDAIRGRIFDPFFTTKPVGKGSGQGLNLTRSVVVDRHHGSIDVVSKVGVGTKVTLRIPISGQ
jgi:PAS domain S-box-containing protein